MQDARINVLDDGFVRLVSVDGDDTRIVQAARVSYGEGTKTPSTDRTLIRYLMRHRHTTPFEMASMIFHVRVPMDCWRQWIRHRTACLAGDTMLHFDLPGGVDKRGNRLYKLSIKEVFDRFQPTENIQRPDKQGNPNHKRERVQDMMLRSVNEETGVVQHTRVVDVWQSGEKDVFRVETKSGASALMSEDHLCWTPDGWQRLKDFAWRSKTKTEYGSVFVAGPLTCFADPVVAVRLIGREMTYDIEVEGPWHNFSAGGLIVHNSVNEYSTRYSEAIDSMATTAPDGWRTQSKKNKQGSGEEDIPPNVAQALTDMETSFLRDARALYEDRLACGVAREQARKDLPLSTYTEAYWKMDLHNLFHFLRLRLDSHAQLEIRLYAQAVAEFVKAAFPIAWKAFDDYVLQSVTFTGPEVAVLKRCGWGFGLPDEPPEDLSKREWKELNTKLNR